MRPFCPIAGLVSLTHVAQLYDHVTSTLSGDPCSSESLLHHPVEMSVAGILRLSHRVMNDPPTSLYIILS